MNGDRLAVVAVALVCLFVIGSAAGSLESAVDSSPSDAIDLNYASLPISMSDARQIKQRYNSMTQEKPKPTDTNDPPENSKASPASSGDSTAQSSGSSGSPESAPVTTESLGTQSVPDPPDLLDRLLAFLSWLVSLLVRVLGVVVVLGGVALGVRYRARLRERLRATLVRRGLLDEGETGESADGPPTTPDPRNDVARAWYEMAERLGLDHDGPLTPRERAHLAEKRGADPATVESLTRLFEEVQYGGAPITERRQRLASHHLERFRRQADVGRGTGDGPRTDGGERR